MVVLSQPVHADGKVAATLDNSFKMTPIGSKIQYKGAITYWLITVHKVLKVGGKTYVCSGYIGADIRKEFRHAAKIIFSTGAVIKSGIRGTKYLNNAPEIVKMRIAKHQNSERMFTVYALQDIKQAYGETISCERSRKKGQANFDDGKSRLVIRQNYVSRRKGKLPT